MTTMTEQQTTPDAAETVDPGATAGAVDTKEQEVARKVAIICSKGSLDMAYPGLIMANAARMRGMDAMIFFTFWGLDVVTKSKVEHLHAEMLGNPSSPMPHNGACGPGAPVYCLVGALHAPPRAPALEASSCFQSWPGLCDGR